MTQVKIGKDGYRYSEHSVTRLTYHFVFVTKYRKPFISDGIGDALKDYAAKLCEVSGGKLISAETDRDHMHLLVMLPPTKSPFGVVRSMKNQMTIFLRKRFNDEVKKYIYGEKTPLWSGSYFAATTGSVSMETVKAYIEGQRTDEHKRKYEWKQEERRGRPRKKPRGSV